jgi:hypothetical protein
MENKRIGTDYAELAYNNTRQTSTGYTPSEIVFGYKLQLPLAYCVEPAEAKVMTKDIHIYMQERMQIQAKIWVYVKENTQMAITKQAKYYNRIAFDTPCVRKGDLVWAFDQNIPKKNIKKLRIRWVGPVRCLDVQQDGRLYLIDMQKGPRLLNYQYVRPYMAGPGEICVDDKTGEFLTLPEEEGEGDNTMYHPITYGDRTEFIEAEDEEARPDENFIGDGNSASTHEQEFRNVADDFIFPLDGDEDLEEYECEPKLDSLANHVPMTYIDDGGSDYSYERSPPPRTKITDDGERMLTQLTQTTEPGESTGEIDETPQNSPPWKASIVTPTAEALPPDFYTEDAIRNVLTFERLPQTPVSNKSDRVSTPRPVEKLRVRKRGQRESMVEKSTSSGTTSSDSESGRKEIKKLDNLQEERESGDEVSTEDSEVEQPQTTPARTEETQVDQESEQSDPGKPRENDFQYEDVSFSTMEEGTLDLTITQKNTPVVVKLLEPRSSDADTRSIPSSTESEMDEFRTPESDTTYTTARSALQFEGQRPEEAPVMCLSEKMRQWRESGQKRKSIAKPNDKEWEISDEEISPSERPMVFSIGKDLIPTGLLTRFLTEKRLKRKARDEHVDDGTVIEVKDKERQNSIFLLVIKERAEDDIEEELLPLAINELFFKLRKRDCKVAMPKLGMGNGHLEWQHIEDIIRISSTDVGLQIRLHQQPEFPILETKAIRIYNFMMRKTFIMESDATIVLDMSTCMMSSLGGVRAEIKRAHGGFEDYETQILLDPTVLHIPPKKDMTRNIFYYFCRQSYVGPIDHRRFFASWEKIVRICQAKNLLNLITLMPYCDYQRDKPGELKKIMRLSVESTNVKLVLALGDQQ